MSDALLNVFGLQYDIHWEDKDKNLQHIEKMLGRLEGQPDIVVLPEMFTTGFSMNPKPFAEPMDGETVQWMMNKSKEFHAVFTGSVMIREFGQFRNRLLWVKPNGSISFYDKRHPFCLINEGEYFRKGEIRGLFTYKDWHFMPSICYDLRFPVWLSNDLDYDVLLNVSNWPSVRSYAWKQMVLTRAMENQAYVVAVNRVGTDAFDMPFTGDSMVVSFDGKPLSKTDAGIEEIFSAVLSKEKLYAYREKYPFLKDKDPFTIHTDLTI